MTPLLVMWGKGRHYVAVGGEPHGDVHVIDGAELVDWLAARADGPVEQESAQQTLSALKSFAETHGPARTTAQPR